MLSSKITVLNIRKLYKNHSFILQSVYFEWSLTVPVKKDARATPDFKM